MFEWAKTVEERQGHGFRAQPEPLLAAGVDPARVRGWAFAKVESRIPPREGAGDKFLKPYELR